MDVFLQDSTLNSINNFAGARLVVGIHSKMMEIVLLYIRSLSFSLTFIVSYAQNKK
jgi:hypothetical protein